MTVLYALAAHFVEELDFMPPLMFIGPTDTGKSTALRQLASMCKAPGFQGSVLVQLISDTSPPFGGDDIAGVLLRHETFDAHVSRVTTEPEFDAVDVYR